TYTLTAPLTISGNSVNLKWSLLFLPLSFGRKVAIPRSTDPVQFMATETQLSTSSIANCIHAFYQHDYRKNPERCFADFPRACKRFSPLRLGLLSTSDEKHHTIRTSTPL